MRLRHLYLARLAQRRRNWNRAARYRVEEQRQTRGDGA